MHNWRLLLTRTAPDCQAQAQHLAIQGIKSQCLPLLEISPLPETQIQRDLLLNFDRYTTLIVVSKHAANLLIEKLDNYWPQYPIAQTWFTVGKATAEVLANRNIEALYPAERDNSEALCALNDFQTHLTLPERRVLIVKGEGGRPYLKEHLQQQQIHVETIALYQRSLPHYTVDYCYKTIIDQQLNGIVISSAQSLYNLKNLLGEYFSQFTQLTFFVPSLRVAELAHSLGLAQVINCQSADLNALMLALQQHQPICYNN